MALERIVIEVSGDPKKLKSTISELQKLGIIDEKNSKQFQKNNEKFREGTKKSASAANQFRNALAGVGVALSAAFAVQKVTQGIRAILDTTIQFEAQMSRVKAITGATNEEFKKLTKSANDLGASTKFTATEVGQLQESYGKLGFSTKEILAASEATLNLATATGSGLAEAAEVAGSTLRAFDLDAEETTRVVDVMAASFVNTPLELDTFKESMKLVAPIAKSANIPLETTTALLGTLAKAGLTGSIAGTSLKNLLVSLGDASSDLSKKLGFSVKNSDDLKEAFKQLASGNIDLAEALGLTDRRSVAAFLTLVQGAETVDELTEAYENAAGAGKQMADVVEDNLQGDITKLNSAMDALARSVGGSVSPSLRELTQWFIKALAAIRDNAESIKTFGKVIAIATTFLVGYKGALILARVATKGYNEFTKKAIFTTKGFNAALRANPISLVIGLLASAAAALFLFKSSTEEAKDEEEDFNVELDIANKALLERERLITLLNTDNGEAKVSLNDLSKSLSSAQKELSDLSETGLTLGQKLKVLGDRFTVVKNGVEQIPQTKVDEFFKKLEDTTSDWNEELEITRTRILAEIDALEQAIEAKKKYLGGTDDEIETIETLKKRLGEVTKEMGNQGLAGDIATKSLQEFYDITDKLTKAQNKLRLAIQFFKPPVITPMIPIDAKAVESEADMIEDEMKDHSDELVKIKEDEAKRLEAIRITEAERAVQIEVTTQQLITDIGNFAFDSRRQDLDQELIDLEEQKAFELEMAGDNAQARENIEKKFADEALKIKRKQAQNDKEQAGFNAAISTFVAAAKALEIGGLAGPILAALITALGIAQQIKIATTPLPKFGEGGFIDGKSHAQGGTIVEAERDEFIVNKIAAKRNKALLQDLNSGKMIAYNRPKNIAGTFAENVSASLNFNDQNLLRAIRAASRKEVEAFYSVAEAINDRPNPRAV